MISEPEMDGAAGAAAAHDVVGDRVLGERRPRSHWMWALGGMAVASALWAAAVLVYGADGGGEAGHPRLPAGRRSLSLPAALLDPDGGRTA
ncbi:hypothetical protein [Streptomyces sp. NPDC049944]|uniref:hypothetical protein n=1 Tax=Streptomyces sp. NPDC049944 TaxID=3155657 RepID=UPI00343B7E11